MYILCQTSNRYIFCSLKTVQICWRNLRLLNNVFNMLLTYFLCITKSKREYISRKLATLEATTLAILCVSGTSCHEYIRNTVNCEHTLGVRML